MLTEFASLAHLARLPLPLRRRALRTIWHAQQATRRAPTFGIDKILQYAIRVSQSEAGRLDSEIVYQDWLNLLEWAALVRRSKAGALRDCQSVSVENDALLKQIAQSRRPLILAPLHMGCFALAFAKLMSDYFADRRMLILRAREDRPEETQAMQRVSEIGIDMRFLNVSDKQKYLEAIRFARNGAIIVSFLDLPASYGSPMPVKLFGRPAQLAMGISSLARVTGAAVVPLSVRSSVRGDLVCIGKPFESFEGGHAEKARVAEIVRRQIEQAVLEAPEQWHMWPRLDEFINSEPDSEAA